MGGKRWNNFKGPHIEIHNDMEIGGDRDVMMLLAQFKKPISLIYFF